MEWARDSEQKINYKPSKLSMHTHVLQLPNVVLRFQIVSLDGSIFVCISDNQDEMYDLTVAMPSRFSAAATATKIMGDKSNVTSIALGKQLSTKLGKLVYVSYNLPEDKSLTMPVTKYLSELMNSKPNQFK